MALNKEQHTTNQAYLDAQLDLWHHTLGHIKSMAIKSALDLRIADAIHNHGGTATLPQIATEATMHPSKIPCLRRLMRVLTVTGIFSVDRPAEGGEVIYGLTPASRLLVGSLSLSPLLSQMLHSIIVSPFHDLGKWFQLELPNPSLFELKHGQNAWDMLHKNYDFGANFNDGMVSDSNFVMDIVIKECSSIFQGIRSLIDVGGGFGGAAQAISKAFPHVECSVLDLSYAISNAPTGTNVKYIDGDMFESIPAADVVFLKWVLHDWGDEECIMILKNCKKAIPRRDEGGKVIIIDMVVGDRPLDSKNEEVQALFDLYVMVVNGIERDEQEWRKIFLEAGFSDYKITPVLGVRSIIEVYP